MPPRKQQKPWGYEEIWAETSQYVGKVLFIRAGERLSLQHHQKKEETMRLQSGEVLLTLEDPTGTLIPHKLFPGDSLLAVPCSQ